MKGLTECSGQVSTIFLVPRVSLLYYNGFLGCYVHHLPGAIPLASSMDRPVTISYLACHPHMRHVVCMGGYSDSRIPINGP